jgi:hypothetical protein
MRVRELKLPLAIMNSEFLFPIDDWDYFDNLSSQAIRDGNFLKSRIFDTDGNEYEVEDVQVLQRPWWSELWSGLMYGGRSVKTDFILRKVASHSVDELKAEFERHLNNNPTWWMNNDGEWSLDDIRNTFGSGRNCQEVIERLQRFAREVY